jgi:hypothetical protein
MLLNGVQIVALARETEGGNGDPGSRRRDVLDDS